MEQVLIDRLRELTPIGGAEIGAARGKETPGGRFAELVSGLISDVNQKQNVAESNAVGLAKGEVGIMDAVVSLNEADLSLRMMMQIRDRAIDSYQRILRTL
jgi:flagellar hook-basal body complex protein FliE